MPPALPTLAEIVFQGQACLCVRQGACAYQIVTKDGGRVLGAIAWHRRWGKYCFCAFTADRAR
jgi:hypothetical protein